MRQRGFTFVEMMVAVTILGTVLAVAIPSYIQLIDREKLKSAAELMYSSLQKARSFAKARSENVFITVSTTGSAWCYGMHAGTAACNCNTANACNVEQILSTDPEFNFSTITISSNSLSGQNFDQVRGVVNGAGGSVTFKSPKGKEIRVLLSATGEIRHCSPSGSSNFGAYPTC
ncbi:GspH/FimT family pseudopilin [Chitinibacter sp. FCG-7]|uniref:Type II secretion system protein H n=1 Tax=Chitinibacter mangrovi TaxID=3153927 RepID=A0AAU7FFA1_9NEIS